MFDHSKVLNNDDNMVARFSVEMNLMNNPVQNTSATKYYSDTDDPASIKINLYKYYSQANQYELYLKLTQAYYTCRTKHTEKGYFGLNVVSNQHLTQTYDEFYTKDYINTLTAPIRDYKGIEPLELFDKICFLPFEGVMGIASTDVVTATSLQFQTPPILKVQEQQLAIELYLESNTPPSLGWNVGGEPFLFYYDNECVKLFFELYKKMPK